MAGHDWEGWFEREELIGQISDIRVQNLQVEREVVQKRTFTRWMNLHLEKCDPPLQVQDLFQDIQDGHVLMALLEELSGCRLLHSFKKSSHRIFRLNNIAKVLSFLEERNVKLVSIDAADVADGNSSIILGLIWNIILFFQIKELTGNIRSQFPSSSSLSSIPTSSESDASFSSTPSEEKQSAATAMRENSKAIKKLLQWVQRRTRRYGVAVQDFGKSWTSGLAFLAVIKSIDSSLVDMRKSLLRSSRENLEDAFRIAHYSLGIPRLLEAEDVTINTPDEQSIIMYVSQFLEHFPGVQETEEPNQVIERSVSMGRLNFRDGDLDHVRNGADRSTVRQRSEMFQRDSTQPPPKVLISSVSEDRGILLPRLKVAAPRAWSSEDFLTDSAQMEDLKDQTAEVLKDSPQQTFTHSPSSVPESLIGDSAINSPDSWVESELMPERFSESRSESSLWDIGTTWDVYRATPVEVTPVDEGFISIEDRVPDGRSMTESYVDEGISSMDSNQDQIYRQNKQTQEMGVKIQEHLEKFNQDLVTDLTPDQEESNFTKQNGTQQMDATSPQKDKEPSVTLCSSGPEDLRTDSLDQFKPNIPSSQSPLKDQDGKNNIQHESLEQRLNSKGQKPGSPPEDERKDSRNKSEVLNECTDVTVGEQEELLRNSSYCEESILETLEDPCSTNKGGPSKTGLNIPLISITSEPEEEDQEPDPGLGGSERGEHEDLSQQSDSEIQNPLSPDGLNHSEDKVPLESPSNMNPENIKLTSVSDDWHLDDRPLDSCGTHSEGDKDKDEANQKECSAGNFSLKETDSTAQCPPPDTQNQPIGPGEENRGPSDGDQDKLTCTSTEPETQNTQRYILDPFNTQRDILDPSSLKQDNLVGTCSDSASVSRNVDQFYSDFDGNSLMGDLVGDPVEPMDLFYPDKEEPMIPEPTDAEMQRWPSVLSVSALQPAPASDDSEDQQLDLLSGDFTTGEDQDLLMNRTGQNHADLSQDQCVLCGVMIGPPAGSREGSLRSKRDEVQIAPVLRHRKGSCPSESTDRRRPAPRSAEDQDSGLWWRENRELCVLLLLWLLLYSIMLLKELDLKATPGLLVHLIP